MKSDSSTFETAFSCLCFHILFEIISSISSQWNISFTEQWEIRVIKIVIFINIIYRGRPGGSVG